MDYHEMYCELLDAACKCLNLMKKGIEILEVSVKRSQRFLKSKRRRNG